jgi:hypothetical protein
MKTIVQAAHKDSVTIMDKVLKQSVRKCQDLHVGVTNPLLGVLVLDVPGSLAHLAGVSS